ncbi:hypothetical protein Pmani_037816 [Petrolisthes manimaculis]|uniref:Uncharacterized protein n=1 Tax=Petrolisthes manimaculis TaxID=1843537 RepID=A0AAE1TL23_9EUCA|nr:hypothetical protein Pmani_037816 [Petrolisthes manimaculis]
MITRDKVGVEVEEEEEEEEEEMVVEKEEEEEKEVELEEEEEKEEKEVEVELEEEEKEVEVELEEEEEKEGGKGGERSGGVSVEPGEVHGGNIRELVRHLLASTNPASLPPARIENARTLPSFIHKIPKNRRL